MGVPGEGGNGRKGRRAPTTWWTSGGAPSTHSSPDHSPLLLPPRRNPNPEVLGSKRGALGF